MDWVVSFLTAAIFLFDRASLLLSLPCFCASMVAVRLTAESVYIDSETNWLDLGFACYFTSTVEFVFM